MAVLQVLQGLNPGTTIPLEGASVTLGRHPACDIVLESGSVSRQHARILNVDGDYYVEDLHSRNGTMVNGRPITQRQLLTDDDQLGICDLSFAFRQDLPEPSGELPTTRHEPIDDAVMVDDEQPTGMSTVMSKVMRLFRARPACDSRSTPRPSSKALIEISQSLGRALGLAEVLAETARQPVHDLRAGRPRLHRAPRSADGPARAQGGQASPPRRHADRCASAARSSTT